MKTAISQEAIQALQQSLNSHPVYSAIRDIDDLRLFMQHHVFSVWDFMSLIKYLQNTVAPTSVPWTPRSDPDVCRFINELVLEEESDETHVEGEFSSHFELYLRAMDEVGADTKPVLQFIEDVRNQDVRKALTNPAIPSAARLFTTTTFDFIESGKPHEVAAALALGREHIIPVIFRAILDKIGVPESQAPVFHFYLNKHIHLDEDFHAPLSLKLLNSVCDNQEERIREAEAAARAAVDARIAFWDGVLTAIRLNRS